ncbi:MAG: hypothetical protein A2X64_02670 [Ignavibacteria bacterium GWF2_33_9]|nr:MAG: hypothetical protein A2X64_02670 [Ignavibacteria bacterium GWF2_33_9]
MKIKIIFLIFIIIISLNHAFSKEIKGLVSGKTGDNKLVPLPNANLQILGTNKGTLANKDGEFTLDMQGNDKVIISYVGYKKDTIEVENNNKFFNIVLLPELVFDEVLVEDFKPESSIDHSEMVKSEVITSRGLQKAACCNLSESFQTNPSVDVTFTDAITGAKQIQLLGLNQTYTQLLTEKVPNLQGLASGFGLGYVPGPWMNSIYISKGAASVSTGYESITGQINVDYKYPEQTDKLYVNLYSNDVQRIESSLITKYNLSDKLQSAVFLHANTMRKLVDENSDGFADIPKNDQIAGLVRLNYDGDIYESKTIFQTTYDSKQAGQIDYLKGSDDFWGADIDVLRNQIITKNGFIFPGERFKSFGTIFAFTNHQQKSMFGARNYDAEQNALNINFIWQSTFDKPDLTEEEHNEAHSEDEEWEKSAKHSYNTGISFNNNNYLQNFDNTLYNFHETVPGLFFEYTYSGIKDLVLTAGVRSDWHNLYGTLITPRFHLKYKLDEFNTVRASMGKGYHNPLPFAENMNVLSSSRNIIFDEKLKSEEAWNYGINTTHDLNLLGFYVVLNTEYYRTNFVNQTIVDLEKTPGEVHFYNLKGNSYSNSFQIDANIEFFPGLNFMAAYRLNDVKITINDELLQKPLISKDKFFLNLSYALGRNNWNFDFTTEYNGGGRLPNTSNYPAEYQLGESFPSFVLFHGQITKRFKWIELYVGGENLGNFTQKFPILAANDVASPYFDSSLIWGPIHGRKIYFGTRLIIN